MADELSQASETPLCDLLIDSAEHVPEVYRWEGRFCGGQFPLRKHLLDAADTIRTLQADLQSVRRLTIKYHGLGMKDPAQWRVGLEEIASIVAEEGAGPDTRDAAALQAENERLREVLGKINAIEDAEYPSEDEYGYESCHVEGYNAGLSECRKTILLALKDALKEQSNG